MSEAQIFVHGTAVAFGRATVLLRGASGTGKSDLALRLLALGSEALAGIGLSPQSLFLVADDQVRLERRGTRIVASAPETIHGRMEVRGLGIVHVPTTATGELKLLIDLVPSANVPRLPLVDQTDNILGLQIPVMKLTAFEASAPLKVALALLGHPDLS